MTASDRTPASSASEVTVTPPSMALQRKVGGPVARLISPQAVKRAEAALETTAAAVRGDVLRRLQAVERAAKERGPNARDAIWADAHQIRGMAGTVRLRRLGEAADLLCRYLDDSPVGFSPDPDLTTSIVVIALHALKDGADADPLMGLLISDSRKAVETQRRREGRRPLEG